MRKRLLPVLLILALLLVSGCSGKGNGNSGKESSEKGQQWAASDTSIHTAAELPLTGVAQRTASSEKGIVIRHKRIDEIPVYEMYPSDAKLLPMVLFLHEHGGSKEQFLEEAVLYAQAGYFCVLFDLKGYGERISAEPLESIEAAVAATSDLDLLLEYYRLSPYADSEKFALYGQSMGGSAVWHYAAFGRKTPLVLVACSAAADFSTVEDMGSVRNGQAEPPAWDGKTYEQYCAANNPIEHTDRLKDLPMLVYQGMHDTAVLPATTQEFETIIAAGNKNAMFIYDEAGEHNVTPMFLNRIIPFIRQWAR